MTSLKTLLKAIKSKINKSFVVNKKHKELQENNVSVRIKERVSLNSKAVSLTEKPAKIGVSELEYFLLTKAPLFMSPLERAISAAGQIKYNSEKINDPKHDKRMIDQSINVYVNGGVFPLPMGVITIREFYAMSIFKL